MTALPDAQIDWANGLPFMAGPYFVGLYQPSPETVGFWEGVASDKLRLKHCKACDHLWHPKRIVCTACGSDDLDWVEAKGTGKIYSFSEVHRAPTPAFAASVPYALGLIQLDEGVHIFTRFFVEPGGTLAIGSRGKVDFRTLELGQKMPVFVVGAA